MPDIQTLIVILIVAAAVGWLVWKFTRKKGACGSCQCPHPKNQD